jgi:diguanylate cyclase (GGDEF)-like protein
MAASGNVAEEPDEISKAQVDACLSEGFRRLRFPAALERRFAADTGPARCRQLIVSGLVALALYNLFLISDWRLVPDVIREAVLVRLGIVTPIALLIVAALFRNPPAAVRETTQAGIAIIVSASVLFLMLISESPLRIYHHYGVVLVILFATVVQRIHFWHAIVASAGSLVLYVPAVAIIPEIPHQAALSAAMVMLGAVVFTLIASYRLEHQLRETYLLSLRDRLRYAELDAVAQTDPLTGLANRRQLDRVLGGIWDGSEEPPRPVAVLLLDVDHFKAFNDRYGHPAGDLCLKRLAAIAAAELRGPEDIAVRFGGEELVIVLRDADLTDGVRIAERIRRAVEAAGIPHEASPSGPAVTVSIGVASTLPSSAITPDELIASADAALYAGKRNGRNQVWPPRARELNVAFPRERQRVRAPKLV